MTEMKWSSHREYTVWKLLMTLLGEGIVLRMLFCQVVLLSRKERVNSVQSCELG